MRLLHFMTVLLLPVLAAYGQNDSISQAIFDNFFNESSTGRSDFATRLYPVGEVTDTVACTLSVTLPDKGSAAPVRVVITCNQRPDQVPPTLMADGQVLEKLSESSSLRIMNGVKSHEYSYCYKFCPAHDGDFACHATDLAFLGTAYSGSLLFHANAVQVEPDVRPAATKDTGIPKAAIVLVLIGCFALSYGVFKVLFRKETGTDFAPFVVQHHRLPLSADWASTHYGLSEATFCLAAAGLIFYAWQCVEGRSMEFLLVIALVLLLIGTVSWRWQRRKLYFKEVRTPLGKEEIFEAVAEVGEKDGWTLDHAGEDCIVTHTNPGMWSLTWGEQIFIVFDEGRIWVNSINDLNKRTNIISFVRTKRNIRKVEEAVTKKGAKPTA